MSNCPRGGSTIARGHNHSMLIGIHPDRIGQESYSDKWSEYLRARNVEVRMVNLLAPDALEQVRDCDGVMWRWVHTEQFKQSAQRILYAIEHYLQIPVFPDTPTAWHYDEKVAQYYLLDALQAPTPQAWVFWNAEEALHWLETAPYPLVFKLSVGAGASNVVKVLQAGQAAGLVQRAFHRGIFPMTMNEYRESAGFPRSRAAMLALLRRMKDAMRYILYNDYPRLHETWWKPEHGYAYFQEYLPDNAFDTRVTVIGERAFAFRRFNRPDDFRASGSGLLDYDQQAIDPRCIEIAFAVSRRGRFQSMAYDFLYRQGEPVICEISYTFLDRAVYACPGHWDRDMRWVAGQLWPEEAQVEDFLTTVHANRARRG